MHAPRRAPTRGASAVRPVDQLLDRSSTAASAPVSTQDRAQRLDAAGVQVGQRRAACRTAPPRRAPAASRAWATSTVRLPSRRSSPAGLPVSEGHRTRRGCRRAAGTPRRGQAEGRVAPRRSAHRRPRRVARSAAGARRCTWRSCSGSPCAPGDPLAPSGRPSRGPLEDVEELAAHQLGAHPVEDAAAPGQLLAAPGRRRRTARRSRSGTGRRRGSRPPIPKRSRVAGPALLARAAWRGAGAPRAARGGCRCRPSRRRAAGPRPGRTPSRSPRGRRRRCRRPRRRATPSSRTPPAAACRRRESPTTATSGAASRRRPRRGRRPARRGRLDGAGPRTRQRVRSVEGARGRSWRVSDESWPPPRMVGCPVRSPTVAGRSDLG